jgi:hypothetical protein
MKTLERTPCLRKWTGKKSNPKPQPNLYPTSNLNLQHSTNPNPSRSVYWPFPVVTAACVPLSSDPSDGFLSPSHSRAQQDRTRQNIIRQNKTRPTQRQTTKIEPFSRFANDNPFHLPSLLRPFPRRSLLFRPFPLQSPPPLSVAVSPSPPLIAGTGCTGILLQFFFLPEKTPPCVFYFA